MASLGEPWGAEGAGAPLEGQRRPPWGAEGAGAPLEEQGQPPWGAGRGWPRGLVNLPGNWNLVPEA